MSAYTLAILENRNISPGSRARLGILFAALFAALVFSAPGANQIVAPNGALQQTNSTSSQELQTYLELQEQLHATQLSVERARNEAEEMAQQNADTLASRLKGIEQSLSLQRAKELDAMQSSNRAMLIVAGSFAGMGFVALLLMGYFQWRTVHRLAELSASLPEAGANGWQRLALGPGDSPVVTAPAAAPEGSAPGALLEIIERLEKRVRELESTPPLRMANGNGAHKEEIAETNAAVEVQPPQTEEETEVSKVNMLLGKGQSLLSMEKAEEALACFDEALALAGQDPEALVKKGNALEKLRKLDEAIECYDKAIAADSSLTIAYLHKGGLFNRMERFNEALECYEKALQTQEKIGL